MTFFQVQKVSSESANIEPLLATRDWMDETGERHAYMCFPLSVSNKLGWGISFPEDLSFVWDGITDTTSDHIKIIKGHRYLSAGRANATISFETGLIFRTDKQTTTLAMPVPNLFVRGAQCYTTLISTSFYMPALPIAWRLTEPNVEITIPAGQPVATILPISLTGLQENYTLEIIDGHPDHSYWEEVIKYGEAAQAKNKTGDWSKMYRDAVDYNGEKAGAHEVKALRLKTVICPHTGNSYEVEDN